MRSHACALAALFLGAAFLPMTSSHADDIHNEPFGATREGRTAQLYTLRNNSGCEAKITNYGGIVVSLTMPDRDGKLGDVVLGFDKLATYTSDEYAKNCPYFGCLPGRFANRIADGRFTLEGQEYHVAVNSPPNLLHGGQRGFDKRLWEATTLTSPEGPSLRLRYVSQDGEEGFPGTVTATAVYTLTNYNELKVDLQATTDKATVVNLSQHSYFNLDGQGEGTILDHEVVLKAGKFLPTNETSIPTGELRDVKGTPFDFTTPHIIGERIGADDQQLKYGLGYDHCYVIDGWDAPHETPRSGALVYGPASGRTLEMLTTAPGVQFYTGNHLDGAYTGKDGKTYQKNFGFCLEPQFYPDAPNHPGFPTATLLPGQTYHNIVVYRFGVRK